MRAQPVEAAIGCASHDMRTVVLVEVAAYGGVRAHVAQPAILSGPSVQTLQT